MPRLSLRWAHTHFVGFVISWLTYFCIWPKQTCLESHLVSHLWSQFSPVFIWATSWENLSSEFCDHVRLKPACSTTEASKCLGFSDIASIDVILSRQRKTKMLIRMRGCAGWSTCLLFAYDIGRLCSLWIDCLFEIRKIAVFPLAFIAGWLQSHWWGFISRNYVVWPTFLLMNVFIALKGSHFWFLFAILCIKCFANDVSVIYRILEVHPIISQWKKKQLLKNVTIQVLFNFFFLSQLTN